MEAAVLIYLIPFIRSKLYIVLYYIVIILCVYLSLLQVEIWLRYVQTAEERRKTLLAFHVDKTASHLGRDKTCHRIKERFMWLGMCKDIQELVHMYINFSTSLHMSKYVSNNNIILLVMLKCEVLYSQSLLMIMYNYTLLILGVHSQQGLW